MKRHITPKIIQVIFTDIIEDGFLDYNNSAKRSLITSTMVKKFYKAWGLKEVNHDRRRKEKKDKGSS